MLIQCVTHSKLGEEDVGKLDGWAPHCSAAPGAQNVLDTLASFPLKGCAIARLQPIDCVAASARHRAPGPAREAHVPAGHPGSEVQGAPFVRDAQPGLASDSLGISGGQHSVDPRKGVVEVQGGAASVAGTGLPEIGVGRTSVHPTPFDATKPVFGAK